MGSIQISSMSLERSGKPGRFSFSRRAHLLTTPQGRWYFLRKPCALRGGLRRLRTPLDEAAFLSKCQPCPYSRQGDSILEAPIYGVVYCHPISPPACVNLPPAA